VIYEIPKLKSSIEMILADFMSEISLLDRADKCVAANKDLKPYLNQVNGMIIQINYNFAL
jgi:hypothetical protein